MKIRTQREAVAHQIGYDFQDLKEYEYQPRPGQRVQIYCPFDDRYFCAVKKGQKPPRADRFDWQPYPGQFEEITDNGWTIYQHINTQEHNENRTNSICDNGGLRD